MFFLKLMGNIITGFKNSKQYKKVCTEKSYSYPCPNLPSSSLPSIGNPFQMFVLFHQNFIFQILANMNILLCLYHKRLVHMILLFCYFALFATHFAFFHNSIDGFLILLFRIICTLCNLVGSPEFIWSCHNLPTWVIFNLLLISKQCCKK